MEALKKLWKKYYNFYQKKKNRKAIFVCSLSIKLNKKIIVSVVGKIKGQISKKLKGKNGFGYDPIFIPDNETLTFAQMSKKKKIKIDHRYIAFMKLKKKFKFL